MDNRIAWILPGLLLIGAILLAGCTTSPPAGPSAPTPLPTPAATAVVTTAEMTSSPATTTPAITVTTAVAVPSATQNIFAEPYVNIAGIKRSFYSISNCTIRELVPAVNKPGYGLNSIKQNSLYFMSAGNFNRVVREYDEDPNAFSMCYRVAETPTWDFVNFVATLTARNPRPTTYNITMVVKFRGVDGPMYNTTMVLNPGQQYPISIYAPIQVDQINNIDGFEFRFRQLD